MRDQTITLRTNAIIKNEAQQTLKTQGYSLSEALNICLEKFAAGDLSILKKKEDYKALYPDDFFSLFGIDCDDSLTTIERIPETKVIEEI